MASHRKRVVVALLAAATALFHLLTASDSWGMFRDELYYLAFAQHLDFGYVDHPPLTPAITHVAIRIFGTSQLGVRVLPALASGLAVYLAAGLAAELGGRMLAQCTTAIATALAPVYLGVFGYLSMNAYDICVWAGSAWLIARILQTNRNRDWIVLGIVLGLGLLNKLSVLFLGLGLAAGLVVGRRWDILRSRWPWTSAAIAVVIFVPHLAWQIAHDWPTATFIENATAGKNLPLSPLGFLGAQVMLMSPAAVPLALGGLWFLLLGRAGKPWRPLGWALVAIVLLLISQRSKAYYLSPAYAILFAAGGVALEQAATTHARRWIATAYVTIVAVVGILAVPLAKPVLSVERYVAYAERLGVAPSPTERHELGRLPQFFADRLGWRELAETVAAVHASLPSEERAIACVFAGNYGQAGAIDHYAAQLDLPPVVSGHNSYHLWGPSPCTAEVLLVIGGDRDSLEKIFADVEAGAVHPCEDCMPYERNKTIWIARNPKQTVDELWPKVRHYE